MDRVAPGPAGAWPLGWIEHRGAAEVASRRTHAVTRGLGLDLEEDVTLDIERRGGMGSMEGGEEDMVVED